MSSRAEGSAPHSDLGRREDEDQAGAWHSTQRRGQNSKLTEVSMMGMALTPVVAAVITRRTVTRRDAGERIFLCRGREYDEGVQVVRGFEFVDSRR
jgi:hypothetical protein